jgi:hypothetical protein
VHHLHRRAVAARDFGGQRLAEDRQVVALGRPDVRGQAGGVAAVRREQQQLGELAGGQPREAAAILESPPLSRGAWSENGGYVASRWR